MVCRVTNGSVGAALSRVEGIGERGVDVGVGVEE